MKSIVFGLISLLTLLPLAANNNLRHWNLTDGSRLHAELVDYDEAANRVYLRIDEKKDHFLTLEDFSPLDQAWLVEWTRMSGELVEMLDKMPGEFTAYRFEGELDVHDFYVYEPSSGVGASQRPLLFLINAGPKGMRYLMRHMEAAEATGMTIVAMDRFGNSHTEEEADNNLTRFLELLPQIMAFEWLLDSGSVEALSSLDDLQPPATPKFPE